MAIALHPEISDAGAADSLPLATEIAAYERMEDDLDRDYFGKWVVFHGEELVGAYDDFRRAAGEAHLRFWPSRCLIRLAGVVRYGTSPSSEMKKEEKERAKLAPEIAAYERMQDVLESDYFGKWVVFHGGELAGAFDTDSKAVSEASRRFGRGPYLIRHVGASRYITLPSYAMPPVRQDADR